MGEVVCEVEAIGSSVGRRGTELGKERGREVEGSDSVFPDVNNPLDGLGLASFPSPLLGKGGSKMGLRIGCCTSPVAAAGSLIVVWEGVVSSIVDMTRISPLGWI